MSRVSWALVFALLGSCAEPAVDPLVWSVDAPGPLRVGYHEIETSYQPPGGLPRRTIPVSFWYPTHEPAGDSPRYGDFVDDPEAFTDAPPAAPPFAGGYPVLVHSHGDAAFAGSNFQVVRYLVSHGWVVIEPAHVGNTLFDATKVHPLALYLQRPLDVRAALDLAFNLPLAAPLSGQLDRSRVAMSGHSFGTYTAWAVSGTPFDLDAIQKSCDSGAVSDCSEPLIAAFGGDLSEPRARVIIPMAGGADRYFGSHPYDPRHLPILLMEGSLNPRGGDSLFATISGADFTWLTIDGGCHELFNLGNTALGDYGNDTSSGHSCSELPTAEGFTIVNSWLLAYLRYQLLDDRTPQVAGMISGTTMRPRVAFHHK